MSSDLAALLTIGKSQFETVMSRLKAALGLRSFAKLAAGLGMSTSAYANRKRSHSIPYEAVIGLALARGVNLDWLFAGEGQPMRDGSKLIGEAPPESPPRLMGEIFGELERAFGENNPRIEHAFMLGMVAAVICNEVTHVKQEHVRTLMIRDRAKFYARIARLAQEVDGAKGLPPTTS